MILFFVCKVLIDCFWFQLAILKSTNHLVQKGKSVKAAPAGLVRLQKVLGFFL